MRRSCAPSSRTSSSHVKSSGSVAPPQGLKSSTRTMPLLVTYTSYVSAHHRGSAHERRKHANTRNVRTVGVREHVSHGFVVECVQLV